MCTLSWTPTAHGFHLLMNRDERRTRARGRRPRVSRTDAGRFLGPMDGDFGGTWIGVNHHGLAAAILNRYEDTVPGSTGRISRGLLLRDTLLEASTPAAVVRRLGAVRLADFQPFTLVAVAPGRPVTILDWTGRSLRVTHTRTPGVIRTSSGSDQALADRARRAVARTFGTGPAALRRLHRSHLPSRGPLSACMHRPEARTQSLTEIAVGRREARIWYAAGAPCRARLMPAGRLAIRPT